MGARDDVESELAPDGPAVSDVWAVVVTYGRRGTLCRRAAESALEAGASHVVIVDNGAEAEARADVAEWGERRSDVTIVSLGRNTGSAYGFGRGLETALTGGAEYVWLLDDDSDVKADALAELAQEAERRQEAGRSRFALVCLRPDRPLLRSLANGRSVDETFPSRSSFLDFNVRDLPRRLARRGRPAGTAGAPVSGLPYAPYGGLFLPRSLAEKIGVPDERLVVYAGDTEFTSRIGRSGADLVLVPRSRILDQTASWYVSARGRGPQRLITAPSDARVYYSVRNRVHFETTSWDGSGALYLLNKTLFLILVLAAALKDRCLGRLRLILTAVSDGEHGRLGRRLALEDRL